MVFLENHYTDEFRCFNFSRIYMDGNRRIRYFEKRGNVKNC